MTGKKIKESLFRQFLMFLVLLLLGMTILLFWSQENIIKTARFNAEQKNEEEVCRIGEKIDERLISIQNMMANVAYNPITYEYYKQESERPFQQENLSDVLINAMLSDDEIYSIELYNDQNMLLIREGRKYSADIRIEDINTVTYSNRILRDKGNNTYFAIYFPIYDLKNVEYFSKLGVCVFYLSTNRMEEFLNEANVTKGTCLYVTDGVWDVLAQNGEGQKNKLDDLNKFGENYQILKAECARNSWTISGYAPVAGFWEEIPVHNKRVFALYFGFIAVLGVMVVFICRAVFAPIHEIAVFVKESPFHLERRITGYKQKNEIGILAGNINRMLDERTKMEEKVQKSQQVIYEEQIARKQMEILAYRNQINPHFLYNTLECIRAMSVYYGCEQVGELTVSLSNMLRYAVKGGNMVTVADEITYIKEYGKIIECRFSSIKIFVSVCEELNPYEMVRLTLQPLVENAVLHGVEPSLNGGYVKVSVLWDEEMEQETDRTKKTERRMVLRVEDNGRGMSEERYQEVWKSMQERNVEKENGAQSIGLANIYQRLKLIYGDAMQFKMYSTPENGTVIEIHIPAIKKQNI